MLNRIRKSKAFTLIEILIVVVILGILAAIVIPQFTRASEDAQIGNVQTQLQTIRSQVELFRVKNNGQYPAFPYTDNNGWGPLVGPDYMKTAPVNPRTGSSNVITGTGTAAADTAGWIFTGTEILAGQFDEPNRAWHQPSGGG